MDSLSHACAWLAAASSTVVLLWVSVLAGDLVRRSKIPMPASYLSVLALFAISLISFGVMVLLAEAVRRQGGAPRAVDGVMFLMCCAVFGAILFLGTSVAAGVLFFRRRVRHESCR